MKLMGHQIDGINHVVANQGIGAIYHDIGLGKTLTGLMIFNELRKLEPDLTLFVICPISLIEGAWIKEIEKWTSFTYINMREKNTNKNTNKQEKNTNKNTNISSINTAVFNKSINIYLINYEIILSKKFILDIPKLTMCIIDESSKIKNNRTKTAKKILKLSGNFKYRVVMSGTPAPNTLLEIWGQMAFLQRDVLFDDFYKFRNTYFYLGRENEKIDLDSIELIRRQLGFKEMLKALQEIQKKGFTYQITDVNKTKILSQISHLCSWKKREDCLGLPDEVEEIRYVQLTGKQLQIYNDMKKYCLAEIANKIIATQTALGLLMKLRQICNGFLINQEEITIFDNAKQKELINLLEEIGNKQIIIWCQFRQEIRDIAKLFGNKCCTLYGETDDKLEAINDFMLGKKQYLIAHPRSGGHGLTFTNCCIEIFHSFNYSWEEKVQCQGRVMRTGQTKKCVYIYLICKNTIEENIYQTLLHKGSADDFIKEWSRDES